MRGQRKAMMLGAAALAMTLGGCVQATRHSNAIVFGTNTSFGIKVGPNATSTPSIVVGYDRQEAVLMPVVANTGEAGGESGNLLSPCNLAQPVRVEGAARFAVHPCSLVAVNGHAMDSYSVLASFGADFSATTNNASPRADGGLAQYFSTGIAAQLLALNGGASVVATGTAANAAASNPVDANTVSALYGGDPQFQAGMAEGQAYVPLRNDLLDKIRATDAGNLSSRITAFENSIGWPANLSLASVCTTRERCVARARDYYSLHLPAHASQAAQALTAWNTP